MPGACPWQHGAVELCREGWGVGSCPALSCPFLDLENGVVGEGCLQGRWVGSLRWVAGGEKSSQFRMRRDPSPWECTWIPKTGCEWKEEPRAHLLAGIMPPPSFLCNMLPTPCSAPSLFLPSPLPAERSWVPRAAASMGACSTRAGVGKGDPPCCSLVPHLCLQSFPFLHLSYNSCQWWLPPDLRRSLGLESRCPSWVNSCPGVGGARGRCGGHSQPLRARQEPRGSTPAALPSPQCPRTMSQSRTVSSTLQRSLCPAGHFQI